EAWLSAHPHHIASAEGYGVRYYLGKAYFDQAQSLLGVKNPTAKPAAPQTVQAQGFLKRALALFKGLDESENDYTAKARQRKFQTTPFVPTQYSGGDVKNLRPFEKSSPPPQLESPLLPDDKKKLSAPGKPPAGDETKPAATRASRFQTMIEALLHGLAL